MALNEHILKMVGIIAVGVGFLIPIVIECIYNIRNKK